MFIFLFICITSSLVLSLIKKFRKISISLLLVILLILILLLPKESLYSAKEGINLWLFVVIPSLLPFFIINDILISLDFPENIARLFAPAAKYIFKTSGYGMYVFIMSIFCGYPSGARIVAQLINEGKISTSEGEKILNFSSTSGPLFIIGAVGSGMLNSNILGYILYISHVLGAILNGIIINSIFYRKYNTKKSTTLIISNQGKSSSTDILSKSILNSLVICGIIGGYIILFSVVITLLNDIKYFDIIKNILINTLGINWGNSNIITYLIQSSLEISNGCKIISNLTIKCSAKLYILSFIIAFSGLSIIGQVSSVISRTKISLNKYIISKINHGVLSSLICYLIIKYNIFNTSLHTININIAYNRINIFTTILIFLITIFVLNILYLIKIYKNRA